jgi:biopolymer transport protein ExbB/biopolymer transport protein TolQ
MQFTLTELWAHMGLFARLVVAAMALMSVASLLITGERVLFFWKSRDESKAFAEKVAPVLERGDLDGAAKLEAKDVGYLGRVILAGLAAYRNRGADDYELTVDSVARALERQTQREVQTLKRGQGLVATVGSTAPFVGLLGTVVGIVNSFQMMAASGSSGLGTVSAGISEALVTTAFGLLVAIPAVMAYNFLQGWVEARSVDISESSNELLDLVARTVRTGASTKA